MLNELIQYMQLHLLSLKQDMDPLDRSEEELLILEGEILATEHLLSVANGIINNEFKGK
jgi:hypothetical protein